MRKAPKLISKILHLGNCKQNFPTALAILNETIAAAIQSYIPDESSTVEFLKLFSKCWVISNSKTAFSTNNYLGNAEVNGDQKPWFVQAMGECVQAWQTERIPNCKKITNTNWFSTCQKSSLALSSLIEDLLGKGYMILY